MNLTEIERNARALMVIHGVGHLQFKFDGAKSRLGQTMFRVRGKGTSNELWTPVSISLSKHYAQLLPADEIRETMLHEIAHALTPGHQHNHVWKAKAVEIGAKPERCGRPSAEPVKVVEAKCHHCNTSVHKQHRLPLRLYVHRWCGKPLVWYRNGVEIDHMSMPAKYVERYVYYQRVKG